MALTIEIRPDGNGERFDRYLVRHLTDLSRSAIQKRIEDGAIELNGEQAKSHRLLRIGDRIAVHDTTIHECDVPAIRNLQEPTVLFENESFLVIDKPSGLTVHPGIGTKGPTLVDWLKLHVHGIGQVGDDPSLRPGIVHRLDRDVSGVMVIAKTQPSFENLKQQFKDREIEKEYVALVNGIPKKEKGIIDLRIGRSKRLRGKMTTSTYADEGRDAVTHFAIIRHVKNNALLRITTETGRMHQIRVHLKAIGHPIVGDNVYTTKPYRKTTRQLERPFLHASRLSFTDITGERLTFESPLPEELRRAIEA
ncbi:MAG: RluA family pseudouridine synthase [Candidatus Kerfeldbacteria bacterium]